MGLEPVCVELTDGQTGYDAVDGFIKRFWEHNIYETVIVSIDVSYDGLYFEHLNEVAFPYMMDSVEYQFDWWEGQKYIKILGIVSISEIEVSGGVYK